MTEHKVAVEWIRNTSDFFYETYNRTYTITYSGGKKIQASNPPQYFGEAEFPNPEELLLSAVSSCYMQTFLAVACKFGFIIDNYADIATGVTGKNEKGKNCITDITLNAKVTFAGTNKPDSATLDKIRDKSHDYCFISNTVNSSLTINIEVQ
ncbi:OsmC family protein [Legionella sainthelensi]|uniref:Osmotically inducible protein OsmC n=1 Tax=Legionella sainthelensi TaxID=28087 RepID=A0A2H5FK76_9GAMM|nr:OsmC family protein [Legionella sainthelensi]AUH71947.1 OsmC family peroxiredoxin [Legionella sainthelensi]